MWSQNFVSVFGLSANVNFYAFLTPVRLKKFFLSVLNWLVLNSSFPVSFLKVHYSRNFSEATLC